MKIIEKMLKSIKILRNKLKARRDISIFTLNFYDKETERCWRDSNSEAQAAFFSLFLFIIFILMINSTIFGIYDQEVRALELVLPGAFIAIISIAAFVFLRKKRQHSENVIFALVLILIIWQFEANKVFIGYSSPTKAYYAGSHTQLLLAALLLAKFKWIKTVIITSFSSFFTGFRFINDDNTNISEGKLAFLYILSSILLFSVIAYCLEKMQRRSFQVLLRKENSLVFFKDLLKDFFPHPILITIGDNIVFENKEAFNSFGCKSKEELRRYLDKLQLENTKYEQPSRHPSLLCTEDFKEIDHFNIHSFRGICDDEIKEDVYKFKNMTVLDMLTNTAEFQRPHLPFFIKMRGIIEHKNNTTRFDIKAKNIVWEDKFAVMLIFTENKFYQKIKNLKDIASYKENMLATFSHNLRSPLNGIIGLISENLKYVADLVASDKFNLALHSSKHLLSTINDILDFHQINNGKFRLHAERFSIWELIEEVSLGLTLKAELKGLGFNFNNKTNQDPSRLIIKSDRNRLKQILLNLLLNALKFTEQGLISLTLEKFEDARHSASKFVYLIRVTDTGCGIKESDQENLFTLFGKIENSQSLNGNCESDTGIGLGLTVSQNLVKLLNKNMEGGIISVSSEVNKGSCFSFPLINNVEEEIEENVQTFSSVNVKEIYNRRVALKETSEILNENIIKKEIKVLVVDDDPINIVVARSYLKSSLFKIDIASNGLDALNLVKSKANEENCYDIILMDCNMPVMNGFEATEMIKNLINSGTISNVPIIACTANVSESDYKRCFSCGMIDYLSKPFTKKELFIKIKTHLGKKFALQLKEIQDLH